MNQALSPIFSLVVFITAFITAQILVRVTGFQTIQGRNGNIDGLRGFLAIGVFIHHVDIWFHYLQTGLWNKGSSDLYAYFGGISVSFFFMITAFLFVSRILQFDKETIDWKHLFIARFFRLFPMYFFSLLILLFIIFQTSSWEIKVGWFKLIKNIGYWLTFTIFSDGIINANNLTGIINAGVVWSLPFEWVFYFSLPVLALLITGKHINVFYIILGLLFVSLFIKIHGFEVKHILSFAGGSIAPFVLKYGKKTVNYNKWYYSLFILGCFGLIAIVGDLSDFFIKSTIALIFTLIALGNNLWGLLNSRVLKFLGEICYSTYLLHGIVIFIAVNYLLGSETVKGFPLILYYLTFIVLTPVIVGVSYLGFRFIEKPFMSYSKKIKFK
ncbi:MAG: hypothetical protein RLZZ172_1455 [Bacteroidota bacterium]|jgi:peptidoglycan/LPS O-acetylase OafA/YrhL